MENQGLLDVWDDRQIGAGKDWLKEIEAAIERASVAVLLISADFLTSKFILSKEVPRLLERRSKEGLAIFPVIVRPCVWQEVKWLSPMQARPLDGRPLKDFRGSWEGEVVRIAKEILQLVRSDQLDFGRDWDRLEKRDDFLSRVEAVIKLREPKAQVERIPGFGAWGDYLRVCRHTGDFATFFPIGAIEHGLSGASFRAFLDGADRFSSLRPATDGEARARFDLSARALRAPTDALSLGP